MRNNMNSNSTPNQIDRDAAAPARSLLPAARPRGGLIFLTADTAYKARSSSDRSVIRAWLGTSDALYCLDAVYGRWEFPELLARARAFWLRWQAAGAREFWVEDKASGAPLAQTLRAHGIPAQDWRPADFNFPEDKVGRMNEAAWAVHAGQVLLPEGGIRLNLPPCCEDEQPKTLLLTEQARDLAEECAAFNPDLSHAHDDHCDTLAMAVAIWRDAGGGA